MICYIYLRRKEDGNDNIVDLEVVQRSDVV